MRKNRMGEVTFEIVIAMPRTAVWAKLRDLRSARHYVPGVTAIELNTSRREGVGASRKVFMAKRRPMDETAIAWEDERGYTLKIHDGEKPPAPFKSATFQYLLDDAPGAQTRVRGTFAYEMSGLFGWLLEVFVLKRALARSNATVAANMKSYYETEAHPVRPD
jgi:Polyketide cyclase / dehydrase and lipid transport